ncbi:FmdB family zinc ribbon protein [Tersicoccus sp. Bi-70]|uniref:FmdB family zinc ribbon protein n=1 Tax=Tersicoccus sp. Bi-70 TaxID=1897634 RepID=UPI000975CAE1|nr:FmdB family zinc ribbon protein [Tersicoccus sp. Bi-70]OMH34114.1 hypothetical protein BGP79_02815 [Tersicoccus sp. Bi-70]
MPSYDFRCDEHGLITERHAMSEVPACSVCPACSGPTRRVFSAPALGHPGSAAMRAIDATKQTAESPRVVSALPGNRQPSRPVSRDPRHSRLPRP